MKKKSQKTHGTKIKIIKKTGWFMYFELKKMTVKDSRELKNKFDICLKIAEEKGYQVGSILNMEMQEKLKQINLNVKKETAEQYRKLFNHKMKISNVDIVQHLLECSTKNTFDKTRSAFRFCIAEKIQELRTESDKARKLKNYDVMKEKTIEAYKMFFLFEREFINDNRVVWNDISYRKKDSKSKKKTMNSVSSIKAVFEDLRMKPELFDKYSLMLAISSLTGCRPAELQKGIEIRREGTLMHICISGAKVGSDRGQEKRILKFNVDKYSDNEQMNCILKSLENNKLDYSCSKKDYDALRQYLYINHKGFSLYTLRHRVTSDLKKEGFDPVNLAAFLGHRTTKSQQNYGYARSGKKGPGVAGVDHTNAIKSNAGAYGKTPKTPGNLSTKTPPKGPR